GLNGRIPLNTAGNLAGVSPSGPAHAAHLGNSVSEVDPTYAFQNAYQGSGTDLDPFNVNGLNFTTTPSPTANTQTDNSRAVISTPAGLTLEPGIDVRLTQLRNLLAGTRPQQNPFAPDTSGTVNGDDNIVFGAWNGVLGGQHYGMPNGIAEVGPIDTPIGT